MLLQGVSLVKNAHLHVTRVRRKINAHPASKISGWVMALVLDFCTLLSSAEFNGILKTCVFERNYKGTSCKSPGLFAAINDKLKPIWESIETTGKQYGNEKLIRKYWRWRWKIGCLRSILCRLLHQFWRRLSCCCADYAFSSHKFVNYRATFHPNFYTNLNLNYLP